MTIHAPTIFYRPEPPREAKSGLFGPWLEIARVLDGRAMPLEGVAHQTGMDLARTQILLDQMTGASVIFQAESGFYVLGSLGKRRMQQATRAGR